MFERDYDKILLLHHWDTDGICSARLLYEEMCRLDVENRTPRLGNYFLTSPEIRGFSKFDLIVILDMALPNKQVIELSEHADVAIFDHHIQEKIPQVSHYNPISEGASPADYPSASWVIKDYLDTDVNLYALLGVIGDREIKIKENPRFWDIISEFCKTNELRFEDMLKMVYLLDSNYKIGAKNSVEEAPRILLEYEHHDCLLNNKVWNYNLKKLEEEIDKQINDPSNEINGITLKRIHTDYNIISTITRQIAWDTGRDIIVYNTGWSAEDDQVYIRSRKTDLINLIKQGKESGLIIGGKNDVIGAILSKKSTEFFIKEVINYLKNQ